MEQLLKEEKEEEGDRASLKHLRSLVVEGFLVYLVRRAAALTTLVLLMSLIPRESGVPILVHLRSLVVEGFSE